jgi:hypothetical protein
VFGSIIGSICGVPKRNAEFVCGFVDVTIISLFHKIKFKFKSGNYKQNLIKQQNF